METATLVAQVLQTKTQKIYQYQLRTENLPYKVTEIEVMNPTTMI
jgi:hypothetical protein